MGNLGKDTTEVDLWAFDDLDAASEEILPPAAEPAAREIPKLRKTESSKVRETKEDAAPKPMGSQEAVKVNVSKNRGMIATGTSAGHSKPGGDFDDLDHWDESAIPEAAAEPAREVTPPAVERVEMPPPVKSAPVAPELKLNLSKFERIGLLTLLAVLVLGGIAVFLGTINRLPTGSDRTKANDFPIQGQHLAIASATSFWRAPKSAETVRRGTQLMPVLELTSTGSPAAIRVFFRNGDGEVVGDAVTRRVQAGAPLQIAATAGFDDVGMHAAYRTGRDKAWTIEVLEAPSENASGADFKKLFEMDVSQERR